MVFLIHKNIQHYQIGLEMEKLLHDISRSKAKLALNSAQFLFGVVPMTLYESLWKLLIQHVDSLTA